MQIEHNKSLQQLNTFGFAVFAERYVAITSNSTLIDAVEYAKKHGWPVFVLGSGSNLVLTRNIPGLVLHMCASGTHYEPQSDSLVEEADTHITIQAGSNWHSVVRETVQQGFYGIENLSLIPGTAGAAPVQNIGAYGVELADMLVSVEVFHMPTHKWRTLRPEDCEFSYRNSLFKQAGNHYVIASVTLRLSRDQKPDTSYASLADALEKDKTTQLTPLAISDAICKIRMSKLPDPAVVGNAGSFFHNPIVSATQFEQLRRNFPGLVHYTQPDGRVKLAAGWLIDQLGFRGARRGGVGVYGKQALVLVHTGGGSGADLLDLAGEISAAVMDTYGVSLTIEPKIV